jgi:hypothetical protein
MPKKHSKANNPPLQKKQRTDKRKPSKVISHAAIAQTNGHQKDDSAQFYPYRRSIARFILYSPLFLGAFAPSGFLLKNPQVFALIFSGVFIADESARLLRLPGSRTVTVVKVFGCLIVFVILLSVFAAVSREPWMVLLFAVCIGANYALARIRVDTVRRVLSQCVISCSLSSLLGVMGVYAGAQTVEWGALALGIPGSMLFSSSLIVRYANLFETVGWKRGCYIKDKKGEQTLRPLSLTRLVSLLLFLGPAIPAAFSFAHIAPSRYAMIGLVLFAAPKPAATFLNGPENDRWVAERVEQIAVLSPLIMLVLGLL